MLRSPVPKPGKVLAFSGGSGSASVVAQRATSLSAAGAVSVTVGSNTSTGSQLHDGIFDDTYFIDVDLSQEMQGFLHV